MKRLPRCLCLFVVREHRPVEKGWSDHGEILGTRVDLRKGLRICQCVEIESLRRCWHTRSQDSCAYFGNEREDRY